MIDVISPRRKKFIYENLYTIYLYIIYILYILYNNEDVIIFQGCIIYIFQVYQSYNASFFTTWFFTNWTILYFPLYYIHESIRTKCSTPTSMISDSLRAFRDKGLTSGRFLSRSSLFCILWVATNYMYVHSLSILLATDVMTLFATNVACVYLLSWVILHEQFVGVRVGLHFLL